MAPHILPNRRLESAARQRVHRLVSLVLVALAIFVPAAASAGGPENHPPVLAPVGAKMAEAGTILTFALSAADADNDALSYRATGLPAGASVDAATGTFAWTPANGQAGIYREVTFIVSDGASTDTEAVTITCFYASSTSAATAVLGVPTVSPTEEPIDVFWDDDGDAPIWDEETEETYAWNDETDGWNDEAAEWDDGTDGWEDGTGEWDDTGIDDAEQEIDASATETPGPSLFYGSGTGPVFAQQAEGAVAALPSWAEGTAGATRRIMLSLPGISGTTTQGTTWLTVDPSRAGSMDDGRLRVERPNVTATIGTDGLSLQDGALRGRATTIEFEILPMTLQLPYGGVSSSFTVAAMTLPGPASQAVVALSARPGAAQQAVFEQAAADEGAEIASIGAVSTVTIDRVPGMVTAQIAMPAEWAYLYGPETCRILFARPDGSNAAILPTSAAESDGRMTFTATAFGTGTFALASLTGGHLPELVMETDLAVLGADLSDAPASAAFAAEPAERTPQNPGLLWQLLVSTGGAFIG